ncbi:MAG: EAL domain-containing protein [Hyphomicrobiales bacterium]|jgi:predicted signal transduction protein with EAL and GGDEF domain
MSKKGEGLNSIPIRFALMSAVTGGLAVFGLLSAVDMRPSGAAFAVMAVLAIVLPAFITFVAAKMLRRQIEALRRSTEAIANGDTNAPVDVTCACEVGGLADSFRKMVDRLNGNILRMNVLAYTDAITGLPNRTVIYHLLERMTAKENPTSGAILFVDLDGFKRINDRFGHEAGDEVLAAASGRIASALGRQPDELYRCTSSLGELCDMPPDDIVLGRVGGDEFVAILPKPESKQAVEALCHAIIDTLSKPFSLADADVTIGASIGIAWCPEDARSADGLLNIADLAMYEAKNNGRNCFVATTPALHAIWSERREVEADLRSALDVGDIHLVYQPRLAADDLSCVGVEGLARWNHPTRGPIPPDTFIPIAEQSGLIPHLGARMFEAAGEQARRWQDCGLKICTSVNISPAEFADSKLVERLVNVTTTNRIDPMMIELEITESMAMSDFESTQDQMMALCEAGFRIAIDDFGTGYSNLSQLARLPFTSVKIDRSLIRTIGSDTRAQSIVRSVIGMAQTLGLTSVAEGVETQAQMTLLRAMRCDEVQGFLFSRPIEASAVETFALQKPNLSWRDTVQPTRVAS